MAGSGRDSLERLQGLHRDLLALSEERLPNVERLLGELEEHVEEFRGLLEKGSKSDASRQKLSSDTLEIDEDTYAINDAFKESVIQVSDALDLDELEAAKLFFHGQEEAEEIDRSPLASSIILFHRRRHLRLESLRLWLQEAQNGESDGDTTENLKGLVTLLFLDKQGQPGFGSTLWHKCVECMLGLEKWQQQITERVQTVAMTDQAQSPEFSETMTYQHNSLIKQHESLGMIAAYIAKAGYIVPEDLNYLVAKVKTFDKHDANLMHYLPPISCAILYFGSSESTCGAAEASSLHKAITSDSWSLRFFQASVIVIWLAEYSGRFLDQLAGSQKNVNVEKEAELRSNLFMDALKNGALHLMLALCQGLKNGDWYDAARDGFTMFLIQDSPTLQLEALKAEPAFQAMLMEQFQSFTDSFITNMPDTLRKLKFEEDEQRRQMQNRVQLRPAEFELHFERFLILVSYAFTGFPEAAESFWSDADGNLFGFLQWASQRQSTPRVAAFCEMLCSLCENVECAEAAHRFLLQDSPTVTGKLRRNSPLSYGHIFQEIEFYSSSIKDRPAVQSGLSQRGPRPPSDQLVEPESAMMLESYLRLLTQITRHGDTARRWLLSHTTFHLHEHLFLLASSAVESRLRACAFNSLASLLTNKTQEVDDGMWNFLDAWLSGMQGLPSGSSRTTSSQLSNTANLESIAKGFEEPNAFVGLLRALLSPCSETVNLNGCLPFPENLGSNYRMPGIEAIVDFVVGRIFATESFELHDPLQIRILRWNCLSFITACLTSFNEDLINFANRTSIAVDTAMQTSSLAAYSRLHPFARVMEWLFNDSVVVALFETASQDIIEINEADSGSPLILGLLRSLETISLVLSMQPTYFDIVRPIVKLQSTSRKPVVANSSLASFEDVILNHLDFVTSLTLYCGSGHEEIAISALRLLQQLSTSRKLSAPVINGSGRRAEKSRLVTALEKDDQVEAISRSLISQMQLDERELEHGPASASYIIRNDILKVLSSCLEAHPDRPTVAHSLLGFRTSINTISVPESGLLSKGASLLHNIQDLVVSCPWGEEGAIAFWLAAVKYDALAILQKLWSSPMSSSSTIAELRLGDFLFEQSFRQPAIRPDMLWDGKRTDDPEFYISDSADACARYLSSRAAFLDYAATELRSAKADGLSSLVARIESNLLGSTRLPGGQTVDNPSVFNYADFLELESTEALALPESKAIDSTDLESCRLDNSDAESSYNLTMVEQLISLRLEDARKREALVAADEAQSQSDVENIMQCLLANNKRSNIQRARSDALRAWTRLVVVMLDSCPFAELQRTAFALHILQLILPTFERSLSEDIEMAQALAELSRTLMRQIPMPLSPVDANLALDAIEDRILQLLRVSLYAVQSAQATSSLKQACCQICQTYLSGICRDPKQASSRRSALQCVRSVGDRLIETLCDDACTGEGMARTASLLLLEALVTTSGLAKSTNLLQAFDNLNFIQVLVDGLRTIPSELQGASPQAVPFILSYYDATLALLLRISQTRTGATFIMNAGFFLAIRDSGLFLADPDIGLDVENPTALSKYFDLLLGCLRIINSILLSKGSENLQTLGLVRSFLDDYRASIVGILKKSASIGSVDETNAKVMAELADYVTLLITASGFLENDDIHVQGAGSPRLFT
ncbi:MAG: hypothetical protein M1828_005833 [Chrysothrix sp. TS-e1954]|nr:MAG: hypothetical protein M1828_005833 [Chrysothrix sp. TS-e1954]